MSHYLFFIPLLFTLHYCSLDTGPLDYEIPFLQPILQNNNQTCSFCKNRSSVSLLFKVHHQLPITHGMKFQTACRSTQGLTPDYFSNLTVLFCPAPSQCARHCDQGCSQPKALADSVPSACNVPPPYIHEMTAFSLLKFQRAPSQRGLPSLPELSITLPTFYLLCSTSPA